MNFNNTFTKKNLIKSGKYQTIYTYLLDSKLFSEELFVFVSNDKMIKYKTEEF